MPVIGTFYICSARIETLYSIFQIWHINPFITECVFSKFRLCKNDIIAPTAVAIGIDIAIPLTPSSQRNARTYANGIRTINADIKFVTSVIHPFPVAVETVLNDMINGSPTYSNEKAKIYGIP